MSLPARIKETILSDHDYGSTIMPGTIGVLTGGGDCPGLNAAIRAVVLAGTAGGYTLQGVRNGWQGLITNDLVPLTPDQVSAIISHGGTTLGTSRINPLGDPENQQKIRKTILDTGMEALIVVGGNGTLSAAHELAEQGIPIVGIPKTIDNDVAGTDRSFGFDTAVSIVTQAIDRLRTTAESHHRIMVVETMGRDAGWIALFAGLAGGADRILIPEVRFSVDEVCTELKEQYQAGRKSSVIVVAEGVHHTDICGEDVRACDRDECGHEKFVGAANRLGREIETRLGIDTRVTVLGYIQRGGSPTAYDRILATRFGFAAVEQVKVGHVGCMVALQGSEIGTVPLKDIAHKVKPADTALYRLARTMELRRKGKTTSKSLSSRNLGKIL
jgi:ATP-dependent phosphofructokinase / diphosphate-dependent phosphofructokinase